MSNLVLPTLNHLDLVLASGTVISGIEIPPQPFVKEIFGGSNGGDSATGNAYKNDVSVHQRPMMYLVAAYFVAMQTATTVVSVVGQTSGFSMASLATPVTGTFSDSGTNHYEMSLWGLAMPANLTETWRVTLSQTDENWEGGGWSSQYMTILGANLASPFDANGGIAIGSGDSRSLTLTSPNDLLCFFAAGHPTTNALALTDFPSGFTLNGTSRNGFVVEGSLVTNGPPNTAVVSSSNSLVGVGGSTTVAISPAGGGNWQNVASALVAFAGNP